MTTPIVFPDVELWACTYLRAALASYGYPGTYVSNSARHTGRCRLGAT
jgi:hypothetical protein